MKIKELLKQMVDMDASDLFFRTAGTPHLRVDGKVIPVSETILSAEEVFEAIEELTNEQQRDLFKKSKDIDFAIYLDDLGHRFRVSVFMQRNYPSMVIRNVRSNIQGFEQLSLPPEVLERLSMEKRGLVLLTGTMGSGKSTTIASMLEYINSNSNRHILTLEEPIEFIFRDKKCIINQRELGLDVTSYAVALRAFTLQSPDVIFIGNIRDQETMSAAITAAETGVLVLSTLHTINAAQTIERVINFFPPHQHQETRNQLSSLLKGVMSLRLVPAKDSIGRIPAYEVMLLTPTISRLIREGKVSEIPDYISDGSIFGMQSFDQSLVKLVREGKIKEDDALDYADNKDELILALRGVKKS